MTIRNMLLSSTRNPFLQLQFDGEGGEGGGDTGTPAPAAAPAPSAGDLKPLLSDGDDVPSGDPDPADGGDPDPDPVDPGEQTDEQKAAAEEERRAALTDEERAEEDRRAALTDEERAEEDKAKEGAPEEYADFTMPEGVTLDGDLAASLKETAKELNLTQEQAQKFVDLGVKQQQLMVEQIMQQYVDNRTAWREAAQTDKEFGGDKFGENLALGKEAIAAFGSDGLKAYLDETGLGDHPEFLRFAINVGKANSEHGFVAAGKPARTKPFYDHPSSQPKG